MSGEVRFGVLGPLEVQAEGQRVTVGAAKQRVLLAALLLQANSEVRVEELAEDLWESEPPANPPRCHPHLSAPVANSPRCPGPDPDHRARLPHGPGPGAARPVPPARPGHRRRTRPHRRGPGRRTRLLAKALDLWRGPVLVDVPSDPLHRTDVARLTEQHLVVLERRVELDLELGRHAALVAELTDLTNRHPLRERLWEHLLLALFRSDRQAEALLAHQRLTDRLREELGVRPGTRVRTLHEAILRGDTSLLHVPKKKESHPVPAPAQLPAGLPDFVGRTEVLAHLTADPPR